MEKYTPHKRIVKVCPDLLCFIMEQYLRNNMLAYITILEFKTIEQSKQTDQQQVRYTSTLVNNYPQVWLDGLMV